MTLPPLSRCWYWLTHDTRPLTMPRSWLQDEARLQAYADWTELQRESARITKNTQATANDRFWANLKAKRVQPANVTTFPRKAAM